MNRYEPVLGPNTKQWWAWDTELDEYCDPPLKILEDIANFSDDINEQRDYFDKVLSEDPDWLYEEEYRYSEIEI